MQCFHENRVIEHRNHPGDTARALIRRAKQASRRTFLSEQKIRILLEEVPAEVSVAELCRREGIHPVVVNWCGGRR
jgi:hypothetical protein